MNYKKNSLATVGYVNGKRPYYPVRKFLRNFDCRLVDTAEIIARAKEEAVIRGEVWTWMDKWSADKEAGLRWVNDQQTLVIEVPMKKVDLNFCQQIWFFQPDLFGHMRYGVHGFVRLWWNTVESVHHNILAVMG
jgi:hypothetical protein